MFVNTKHWCFAMAADLICSPKVSVFDAFGMKPKNQPILVLGDSCPARWFPAHNTSDSNERVVIRPTSAGLDDELIV